MTEEKVEIKAEEKDEAKPEEQATKQPEAPHQLTQEELDQMSYFEYLKFLNPEKSDEEIAAMIRKENRSIWLVRFEIFALVLIIAAIIWVIFS